MYVDLCAKVPVSLSARGDRQYRRVIRFDGEPTSGWIRVSGDWQESADGGWRTVTTRMSYKDYSKLQIDLASGRYQELDECLVM
jgi:hypothetical protein